MKASKAAAATAECSAREIKTLRFPRQILDRSIKADHWCTGKHRARGTEHKSGGGGNNTKYLGEDRWNYLFLVTITTAAIQKGRML